MKSPLAAVALAFAAITARAQGTVWVVDWQSGPGTDYAQLQPAIDAAASGDMILVRPGSYERFTLDGKGVAICADAGGFAFVSSFLRGPTRVQNIGAGQVALLRGLRLDLVGATVTGTSPSTLRVENVQGRVWLEDCEMRSGYPSLDVEACDSLVVARGGSTGGEGYLFLGTSYAPGGAGAELSFSNARLYGAELVGADGAGGTGPFSPAGTPGIAAAILRGGTFHAARTIFQGGTGGNGQAVVSVPPAPPCSSPGVGGPGLWLASNDPSVQLVANQASGGAGGTNPCGDLAADGPPLQVDSGTVLGLPGEGAALATNSPVREGQVLTATISAPPLSLALLAWSAAPADLSLPDLNGFLHLGAPFFLALAGVVPVSGQFSANAAIQELGPGIEGIVVYAQAASCASGLCSLGAPSAVLLLDSAF